MALIKCAECGKEISDRATTCPACGAPVGEAQAAVVEVTRAGGKWEGWGFVMIVAGLIATMSNTSWGVPLLMAGFAVFLVGRFK